MHNKDFSLGVSLAPISSEAPCGQAFIFLQLPKYINSAGVCWGRADPGLPVPLQPRDQGQAQDYQEELVLPL